MHVRHLDADAGRLPCHTGSRCRWPLLVGPGHHRRHRAATTARQVPGLLPGGLWHLKRPGSGRRRLLRRSVPDPRSHWLALGLPGQCAHRHRRALCGQPHPAPATHPSGAPHRLRRRRRAHHRARPAAAGGPAGSRVGVDLRSVHDLLRHRSGGRHRVLPGRAVDGCRGLAAAEPVYQQDSGRRLHRLGDPGHGHVRWAGVSAAIPADRQGRDPDQRRPDAPAHDPGHDGRLDPLRPDHLQDGPVPAVPDHRLRPVGRFAVRVPLRRCRHRAVADDDPDAVLRYWPRFQHAAADPCRAERRLGARHWRGHFIGNVHTSDRRHPGDGHLLVHPVHGGA